MKRRIIAKDESRDISKTCHKRLEVEELLYVDSLINR